MVYFQDGNGCATLRCKAQQCRSLPAKMISPDFDSRMKQTHKLIRFRIDTGQVRPLVEIAPYTSKRKIGFDRLPTVLPRDDVLYMKRRLWKVATHRRRQRGRGPTG